MSLENQYKLLKHYQGIASNETKDNRGKDFKPILRQNAKKHAEDILTGYPNIEEKYKASLPKKVVEKK